jgi:hypothetical protein
MQVTSLEIHYEVGACEPAISILIVYLGGTAGVYGLISTLLKQSDTIVT